VKLMFPVLGGACSPPANFGVPRTRSGDRTVCLSECGENSFLLVQRYSNNRYRGRQTAGLPVGANSAAFCEFDPGEGGRPYCSRTSGGGAGILSNGVSAR